jgi:ketosteroid isomerase-like protein
MKRVCYLPLGILLFLSGCVQEKAEPDVEKDISAVKAVFEQYCEHVSNADFDAFVGLWAEDARRIEPDMLPIIGIEDIKDRFRLLWGQGSFSMYMLGETEAEVRDDLAYVCGAVVLVSVFPDNPDTTYIEVKFLDILKKQDDGTWKIYIDCFNFNPAWSMDSVPEALTGEGNPYY